MADVFINHRFVSAVADDADTTLVKPSNWNDTEVFSQGNEGDLVVKRAASTTGASWESVSSLISSIIANFVSGPASVVSNTLALFDGTTGKLIKQSIETGFIKATSGVISAVTSIVEADLALTDITTNNSNTSNHGFLKKLSNDSTQFMNGQGNWAVPPGTGLTSVNEADLVFTDITTNNASTTQHGLLRKLDNNASHYLNGQGSWLTPVILWNTTPGGTITVNSTEIEIASLSVDFLTGQKGLVTVSGTWAYPVPSGNLGTTLRIRTGSVGGTLLNSTAINNLNNQTTFNFSFQVVYTAGASSTITFYLTGQNTAAVDTEITNNVVTCLVFS